MADPEVAISPESLEDADSKDKESVEFQILYDLSDVEKDALLTQFNDRFDSSLKYMQTLYPQMIANYKKYRSVADPITDEDGKERTDRANLFIPYPYAIVETGMPRLAGRLPRTRAFPRQAASEERVKKIQDLIYYELDRSNFIETHTLWIRQFEIFGWSPLFYRWRVEKKDVFTREKVELGPEQIAYPIKRVEATVFDDFWPEVLDCFDCFIQPGVSEIETGDWFMFREWHSAKDLRRMVKAGQLYPEVLEYLDRNTSPSHTIDEADGRKERDEIVGQSRDTHDHSYGKYELMWMLEDDRIVQVLDRNIVARAGDNPHPLQEKPIINCNLNKLISEPIGVGTIESLAGLPDRLNALSNARLDNIALLLNRVILANKNDRATDFKNIRFSPGNVILCSDVEKSLKFLEVPDTSMSSEREVRQTTDWMRFVTGISDWLSGTDTQSSMNDTATGASTIVREANARFSLKNSAFESGSLRKLVSACHVYCCTYMPEKKLIHVLGPEGYMISEVTLDDILVECDFIVEPGSCVPLDQLSRRDALVQLFDRLMKVPSLVRLDKLVKELLEAHDIRNVDDLLVSSAVELDATDDVKLARAENISFSLERDVNLRGNDGLHLGIHQSEQTTGWTQNAQAMMMEHIRQHQEKIAQLQQMQMAAQMGMGGQNGIPAPGGAMPQAGGPGLGMPPGIPGAAPSGPPAAAANGGLQGGFPP